ncbi:MAG: efflux transporter outer membrane subunit [Reyranellaceae bacterium]
MTGRSRRPALARRLGAALLTVGLAACDPVGPDYARPKADVPERFDSAGPWREGTPQDTIARGDWWTVFGDPTLDGLQADAVRQSPDLRAAAARVLQAQAVAGISRSYLFPEVNAGVLAQRFANNSNFATLVDPATVTTNTPVITNAYKAMPLYAQWELDFWGRVRRLAESSRADLDASIAAYQAAMLTLNAEVALAYFEIRTTDELVRLLQRTVALHRDTLQLFRARAEGGLGNDVIVAEVDSTLRTVEAQVQALEVQRARLVNRLAVLTGRPPEGFALAPQPLPGSAPPVPVGVPSDLLQRRPDIAKAERDMAAANAQIGVAVAAFYPNVVLTTGVGYEGFSLSTLTNPTSNIWGIGFSLFQQVFNAGRVSLNVERSRAAYEEKVAVYQGQLLRAFQEVETALAALGLLERQASLQKLAVEAASRRAALSVQRYQQGLNSLLEALVAQRAELAAQSVAVQIANDRLLTTVALIKALGGGWQDRARQVPEGSRSMWAPPVQPAPPAATPAAPPPPAAPSAASGGAAD